MPESRKNPDRKGKSIPMNNTNSFDKPIVRQPMWSEDETFPLTGGALAALVNFLEPYRQLIQTVDAIMVTGELEGKIKTEFFYNDRTDVNPNDPRLANLQKQEEARMNHWRELVTRKQNELNDLLGKIPAEQESDTIPVEELV